MIVQFCNILLYYRYALIYYRYAYNVMKLIVVGNDRPDRFIEHCAEDGRHGSKTFFSEQVYHYHFSTNRFTITSFPQTDLPLPAFHKQVYHYQLSTNRFTITSFPPTGLPLPAFHKQIYHYQLSTNRSTIAKICFNKFQ